MSKFQNHNFNGEKALIRVDFNVPVDENYNITDDTICLSPTVITLV